MAGFNSVIETNIIGGQAAKPLKRFYLFLLLLLLIIFLSHWSLWQPLEPYGKSCEIWHTLSTIPSLFSPSFMSPIGAPLVPPTGQSWTCVYTLMTDFQKSSTNGFPGSRRIQSTL